MNYKTAGFFSSKLPSPTKATLRLNTHLYEIYFNFPPPRFLYLIYKPYTKKHLWWSSCCFVLHRKQNFHLLCSYSPVELFFNFQVTVCLQNLNEIPIVCTFLYVTQRNGTVTKNKTKMKTPNIVLLSRFISLPNQASPRFLAEKFNYVERRKTEKSASSPTELELTKP